MCITFLQLFFWCLDLVTTLCDLVPAWLELINGSFLEKLILLPSSSALFILKIQKLFTSFTKSAKLGCNQWCILQVCKIRIRNTLYMGFEWHNYWCELKFHHFHTWISIIGSMSFSLWNIFKWIIGFAQYLQHSFTTFVLITQGKTHSWA